MKHRLLLILIVSIQVLLFVAADSLDKHDGDIEDDEGPVVDDDDENDDEIDNEIIDEFEGIKQSKHERVKNVMHGSDNQSPSKQSQHIKSSHTNKFAGQDLNEGELKETDKKSASTQKVNEVKGKSSDSSNKQSDSDPVQTKQQRKMSKHTVDEKVLFEEAELGEETLTDQVLRLGTKLKAERGKEEKIVETQKDKKPDKIEAKLNSLDFNKDFDDILETKTSVEFVMDMNTKNGDLKTDTVKDINEPEGRVKEQKENKASKAKISTFSQQKYHDEESAEESITEIVKNQGQKVLDSEKVTEGLEEHDDLDFPNDPDDIAAEDEEEDDEILIFKPSEETGNSGKVTQLENDKISDIVPDSNSEQPVKVESLKDTTVKSNRMNVQDQNSKKYSKEIKLMVEESENEDGSLIDEVIKLSEKLKVRMDDKDASDKSKLYQKIDDEFNLIDKEIKNMKTDIPEKPSDKLSYKHVSKDTTEKPKEKVDTDEISKEQMQVLESKKGGDKQNMHKDKNMQTVESLQSVDINGKSSTLSGHTPAKVENTVPPEITVIQSQTQGVEARSKVNSYTKLSADETNIRATPTSKPTEQSPDNIQSPHLHMTPTQTVELLKSAESSSIDNNKPKSNEDLSVITRSVDRNSISTKTELSSSQSSFIESEGEKTVKIVSKTESLVQPSTTELKVQELHSATPIDNIVSSEAIFQSEHTVKVHAEETRKDKKDQAYHKMAPSSVEKTTIMETVLNTQTSTHHTQLGKEGKRKIVGCICWDFCTDLLLYSHVALYSMFYLHFKTNKCDYYKKKWAAKPVYLA